MQERATPRRRPATRRRGDPAAHRSAAPEHAWNTWSHPDSRPTSSDRIRRRCQVAVRLVLALLVTALAVCGPGLVAPPTAQAVEPVSYVSIRMDRVTPAVPTREDDVVLSGTVTNTSEQQLTNLQVTPWRSFDPIQTAEGLQQVLDSAADQPLGYRVFRIFRPIPSAADRVLDPGESTTFSVTVPMAQFDFPQIDATYLVGVHIRGRLTPGGADITLGRGRTLLPLADSADDTASRLLLTPLVVLASRPSMLRVGLFSDDHLAAEIADDGRLRRLLDYALAGEQSFAVDPALIDALRSMRAGYDVSARDGSTARGTGQSAAGEWLDDFAELADEADGYRLLYGSPDVAALVHDKQQAVLRESQEAARTVSGVSDLPLLVLPPGGRADAATVSAAADLNPAAIVLADSTTQRSEPLLAGPDSVPVVNVVVSLGATGPGPDPRDTPVQIRQRLLTEAWLAAHADPDRADVRQVTIVDSVTEIATVRALLKNAPWMRTAPLEDLLDTEAVPTDGDYRYTRSARAGELAADQLAAVRRLRSSQTTFLQLLVDPAEAQRESRAAVARAASRFWRDRERNFDAFMEPQQDAADRLLSMVSVVATPRVVTSARRGLFPVTIRNQLPARADDPDYNAVKARLEFRSGNGQRLSVAPIEIDVVRAQESTTPSAQVEAQSNGTVRVTAQLYTTGDRAIGKAVAIDVNATQAGTIGWLIAIGAGVVLIGTTTWRIRQVARERDRQEAQGPRPMDVSRPAEQIDA